jgi:hypothetical protein
VLALWCTQVNVPQFLFLLLSFYWSAQVVKGVVRAACTHTRQGSLSLSACITCPRSDFTPAKSQYPLYTIQYDRCTLAQFVARGSSAPAQCAHQVRSALKLACLVTAHQVLVSVAGATAAWYFETNEAHPVRAALRRAVTVSYGSVCLGALLCTILQVGPHHPTLAAEQPRVRAASAGVDSDSVGVCDGRSAAGGQRFGSGDDIEQRPAEHRQERHHCSAGRVLCLLIQVAAQAGGTIQPVRVHARGDLRALLRRGLSSDLADAADGWSEGHSFLESHSAEPF